MFRFIFGAALASGVFYIVTQHPEWLSRAVEIGKEQIQIAQRNISAVTSSSDKPQQDAPPKPAARRSSRNQRYEPDPRSATIDRDRAGALLPGLQHKSWDQLWAMMAESDFDRRAAAAQVLLARAGIPSSSDGVDVVQERYLRSRRPDELRAGFSYLGLLATQDIAEGPIIRIVQGYVDRHPRDPVCDEALWALGELGSERMTSYFFEIIAREQDYGPEARERAFCCLVQCGRYSPALRFQMVPRFIQVYESSRDPDTRQWALQALEHCAPGVELQSIGQWKAWWNG
jgi:hypothetical protein